MAEAEVNFRQLLSQLETDHFKGYLLSQGWEERPSRYLDHLYFQGKIHEDEDAYELYLPIFAKTARYETQIMRAIYKLCGIEDREPAQIAMDMLAVERAAPPVEATMSVSRLRIRNTNSKPLHLHIDSPPRAHIMLPGESIELICQVDAGAMLEIESAGEALVFRTPNRQ